MARAIIIPLNSRYGPAEAHEFMIEGELITVFDSLLLQLCLTSQHESFAMKSQQQSKREKFLLRLDEPNPRRGKKT
jgi:hypothetical protein